MTKQVMRLANGDVLEVGDCGITRDGDIRYVGCTTDNEGASFICNGSLYFSDGTFGYGYECRCEELDIVAKAVNPRTLKAVAQLDAKADDTPKTGAAKPTLEDDSPTLWKDMTPEEKGALLLAEHEGKVIEASDSKRDWHPVKKATWFNELAYRIKPEPKREMVEAKLCIDAHGTSLHMRPDYRDNYYGDDPFYFTLTFHTIDGKPDPASIKIEEV